MIGDCSFCNKKNVEIIKTFIKDRQVDICSDCVEQALSLINLDTLEQNTEDDTIINIGKPKEIKAFLDEYVVGQDTVKKILSVAVYNHYKRLNYTKENKDTIIEKSNILLVGDTGSGKTYLAKTLAKFLKVPFCIADATSLTEAGYVGDDVETILTRLLHVANGKVKLAEKGIVYIDEIDKISRKGENVSITRDVSGEGVQQALLKLLEGTIVNVSLNVGRRTPDQKYVKMDTSNILFICGGSFEGLENIIKTRLGNNKLGFCNECDPDNKDTRKNIYVNDLKKFGLIPELIGRLPIIGILDKIDKATMLKILKEPKNSILKQYEELFKLDNIKLTVTDEALEEITENAINLKLGTRGLRSICEKIFTILMYETPSKEKITEINITKDYVKNILNK